MVNNNENINKHVFFLKNMTGALLQIKKKSINIHCGEYSIINNNIIISNNKKNNFILRQLFSLTCNPVNNENLVIGIYFISENLM